ncbi:hypothetical protein CRUP_004116, partial [Coryphaenoides rupestris]
MVLEEAGRPMHIKEIKQRIIDRGLIQSNAKSSLEAVMYREGDGEHQQPFSGPSFLGSPPQTTASSSGSAASLPAFPSPTSSSEPRAKGRRGPRKNHSEKYRLKYLRLRRAARAMIFENAALCDEVAHLEEKFLRAKEERRFLLKSLLQYQSFTEAELLPTPSASSQSPLPAATPSTAGPPGTSGLAGGHNPATATSTGEDGLHKKPKKERRERGRENGKEEVPKRVSKKRKVADGCRKLVQPIALDSSGRPIITDRMLFHDQCAIYPVGFCSTRVFASMKNPEQQCLYTCQIKDGGAGPQFEIVPEEDPQNAIAASSASDVPLQSAEGHRRCE